MDIPISSYLYSISFTRRLKIYFAVDIYAVANSNVVLTHIMLQKTTFLEKK